MKRPSFQFYTGDWAKDPGVKRLSPREKGVYIELLILCFDSGGYVKAMSEKELLNSLNFRVEDSEETSSVDAIFHKVLDRLLECDVIHKTEDGRLYNNRILRDMEAQEEVSQKRSEAGKLGNQKRWGENRKCDKFAIANESHDATGKNRLSSSTSSSTSTSINNPLSNAGAREELKNNLPRTESEAVAMCAGIGVPDDFIIETAYPRAVAIGFIDRGSRIVNWGQWVKNYWCARDNSKRRKEQQTQKPKEKPLGRLYDDTPVRELQL